jgi:hypothetical protein
VERLAPAKPHHGANLIRLFLSAAERQMGTMNGGPVNLASARLRGESLRFATLSGANLASRRPVRRRFDRCPARRRQSHQRRFEPHVAQPHGFRRRKARRRETEGTNLALARNLTQDQIIESLGDAFTLLPHHLEPPVSWTEASDTEQQLDDGRSAPVPTVTARGRGDTMSWLVGGVPIAPAVPKVK